MSSSEMFLENINWGSPVLAKLFTYVNTNGNVPKGWGTSITISIYKKVIKVIQLTTDR